MCFRNPALALTLLVNLALGIIPGQVQAQPDSAFDDIPLNGLAAFEQLRKEYYIGGLYLQSLNQDSNSVFAFSGRKRMEIRITIDKWSPRRFSQQWNQAILINNNQEDLEAFADQILSFVDLPKDDLVMGDRITIDMDPNKGTTVYINNQRMFNVDDNAFFDVLLNTWIGQRPPSSEFKNHILTLPTDQAGTEMLVRYEALNPAENRVKIAVKWAASAPATASTSASAPAAASAALPPPGAETKVTGKRSSKPELAPKREVAVAKPTPIAAPSTQLELEKPSLDNSSAAQTETKPKPKPQPKPKPEPQPKPEPVAKKPEPEEDEQTALLKVYTSNALKLTYLNTQYPRRAMDLRQEGLVIFKVTVNRQGEVENIVEETESSYKLLNRAARKAIKRTEPYPELPESIKGKTVDITMPFNFTL